MKSLKTMRSLLIGLLLICLGSVAFIGCSDNQTLTGLVPSQLTGAIATPKAAPVGVNDTIVWADPLADPDPASAQAAAVSDGLALNSPSMTFAASSTDPTKTPAIILEVINDATGAVVGTSAPIALVQQGNGLVTGQIVLPKTAPTQSYIVRLAPWTVLNVATQAFTRQVPAGLQIGDLLVAFDLNIVNVNVSASYASQFQLNLTKTADNKFKLQDSTLSLTWTANDPKPADGKAGLVLRLYNGAASAGTARQTRTINANTGVAQFSGMSTAPFTKCDVLLDLRDAKPDPTNLNFPN